MGTSQRSIIAEEYNIRRLREKQNEYFRFKKELPTIHESRIIFLIDKIYKMSIPRNFFIWNVKQVKPEEIAWYDIFWKSNYYVHGSYDQRSDFERLNEEILLKQNNGNCNRIFYLALPPTVFEPATTNIRDTCISPT